MNWNVPIMITWAKLNAQLLSLIYPTWYKMTTVSVLLDTTRIILQPWLTNQTTWMIRLSSASSILSIKLNIKRLCYIYLVSICHQNQYCIYRKWQGYLMVFEVPWHEWHFHLNFILLNGDDQTFSICCRHLDQFHLQHEKIAHYSWYWHEYSSVLEIIIIKGLLFHAVDMPWFKQFNQQFFILYNEVVIVSKTTLCMILYPKLIK